VFLRAPLQLQPGFSTSETLPSRGRAQMAAQQIVRSDMSRYVGQRAVVIGAGIGGLCAAGALSSYFREIVVLERDALPTSAMSRGGTPQDRQPHLLLAGGLQALADIFPGFERDLIGRGALPLNIYQSIRYERPDVGPLPQRDCGTSILYATRPLTEQVLRSRMAAIANVSLRPRCRVVEIVPDAIEPSVSYEHDAGGLDTVEAELVVDASGRGVPTLDLFDSLGLDRPRETVVGVDLSYTTAMLRPAEPLADGQSVITFPDPRTSVLAGFIMPIEDGNWFASLTQYGVGQLPKTWQEFLALSRRLNTPSIHDAICNCEPPDGLTHFIFDESRWRHFEEIEKMPRGILPVADSLCRFNPIFGQGMSVAARQARLLCQVLDKVLDRVGGEADPIGALQTGFMSEVGALLQTPWNMGVSVDFAFPGTRGECPEGYEEARQFEAALFRAVVADPVVQRAFADVLQSIRSLEIFEEPDMKRRIDAHAMVQDA
jgi:flavin-dependent dehydrogenase